MPGKLAALVFGTLSVAMVVGCGPAMNPADDSSAPDGGTAIRLPPSDGNGYDCQGVPEAGECHDGVAVYCDRRTNSLVEKRCDARGLTCDDSSGAAVCVNDEGAEEEVTPEGETECGSVTPDGECNGNVLSFCSPSNGLQTVDCGSGATCGETATEGLYACIPPECAGDKETGTCNQDGTGYTFCHLNSSADTLEVAGYSCLSDETCAMGDDGYPMCSTSQPTTPPPTTPPPAPTYDCADIGIAGTCDTNTNTLYYCLDSSPESMVLSQDCSASSQTCEDVSGSGFYACN